jgi:hypothetical protein
VTGSTTWRGRRGAVILGPTEDRVARYLDHATRQGRVTLRTLDLATRLQVERSEIYRITARLRVLGLFGIENDRGGTRGGRRYWRTAIEHDGARLDAKRHRAAWSRVLAWSRARRARLVARIRALHTAPAGPDTPRPSPTAPDAVPSPASGAGTFAERMRAAGLGALMDSWRISR